MSSRIPPRRTLGLGATVLALTATLAPAAHAGSSRHADASGDVRVVQYYSDQTYRDRGADASARAGDITALTVRYAPDEVRVATAMRAQPDVWAARIRTSRGSLVYDLRYRDGRTMLQRNHRYVTCAGARVTPTPRGLVGVVPSRCLGRPARIRVGVLTLTEGHRSGPSRFVSDDALTSGVAFTRPAPTLGSWITPH